MPFDTPTILDDSFRYDVQTPGCNHRNILEQDEPRLKLLGNPPHFKEQTRSRSFGNASTVTRHRQILTGEPAHKDIYRRQVLATDLLHITVDGNPGETRREYLLAEPLPLDKPGRLRIPKNRADSDV